MRADMEIEVGKGREIIEHEAEMRREKIQC